MGGQAGNAGLTDLGARRSLAVEMLGGYRWPRRAIERQIGVGLVEGRALFHLMLGCALLCVASIPAALRSAAELPIADAASAAVASRIFGYVVVLPILAYAGAGLIRLVSGGSGLAVRSALFWSVLLGGPIALCLSAIGPALPDGVRSILSPLAAMTWLWLASASLGAAVQRSTARFFVVFLLLFGILAFGLELAK